MGAALSGPSTAFALHAWDVADWIGDIYRAEQEASIRRREKMKSAFAKVKLMNRLGSAASGATHSTSSSMSSSATRLTGGEA